jgi:hypothetical protein
MLAVSLIVLLIAAGVAVLAAAGTLLIQGYLYNEPVGGMSWRAPAVGAVAGLFFGLWCWIEAKAPGRYDVLWNFSPRESQEFDQFWSERTTGPTKTEILYRKERDNRGRVEYRDADGRPWRRSDNGIMTAIIVEEDGRKTRFEAPLNPDGTFKLVPNEPMQYMEVGGSRAMSEVALGQVTRTRSSLLWANLLLNLAHLLVWFLAFWLLLQFQWSHALGLAAIFWLIFSLTIWPVLQGYVRSANTRTAAQAVTSLKNHWNNSLASAHYKETGFSGPGEAEWRRSNWAGSFDSCAAPSRARTSLV